MNDWDQQVYWERQAARVGGGWPEEETGPTRPVSAPEEVYHPSEDDEPPEGLYESGGRSLRARLITAGVIALLVIGAATTLAAISSSGGGDATGGFAGTPGGVLYPTLGDGGASVPPSPTTPPTVTPTPTPTATPTRSPSAGASYPTSGATVRTNPPPTGRIVTQPTAGLVVRLISRATNGMVAVSLGSTASGAPIVESANLGTAAQWRLVAADGSCFQLLNVHSGMALDNTDGTFADGAQMQQWKAVTGNTNQMWCFQAVGNNLFSIRNQTSDSLLDLRDGESEEGTAIQQWSADPSAPDANQAWQLRAVG